MLVHAVCKGSRSSRRTEYGPLRLYVLSSLFYQDAACPIVALLLSVLQALWGIGCCIETEFRGTGQFIQRVVTRDLCSRLSSVSP